MSAASAAFERQGGMSKVYAAFTPQPIDPRTTADYLAVMSRAILQSGLSWRVVESKWEAISEAFRGFDAEYVARLDDRAIDRLTRDPRVIRNRRKLEAIRDNALRLLMLEGSTGIRPYLRAHGSFDGTIAALRRDFRYLGAIGAHYFLYVVGEDVPERREWWQARSRPPRPPVARRDVRGVSRFNTPRNP